MGDPKRSGSRRAPAPYRLALRALPADFRRRHAPAMLATLRERLDAAPAGAARARLAAAETLDVVATGVRLRAAAAGGIADDVRHALRSLTRNPAHTLFAGATLVLGIGASTAIFSALDSVLLRPLPYPEPERVVQAWRGQRDRTFLVTPTPEQVDRLDALDDVFASVQPYLGARRTLAGRGDPAEVGTLAVRPGFFAFAGVRPVLGRTFDDYDVAGGGAVALLSEGLWTSRFGRDRGALGETVILDGRDHVVVGVLPTRAAPPGQMFDDADVWVPLSLGHLEHGTSVLARLRDGLDVASAGERVDAAMPADGPWHVTLRSVTEMVGSGLRDALLAVSVAVALLLLIACVNVSNLLLARAEGRLHESAVRAALGAARGRLVRQHLLESLLLGAASGVVGLGLAAALLRLGVALRPDDLKVLDRASLNGAVVLFALALSLGTGLVFGVLPALRGTSPAALLSLRGARAFAAGGRRLAGALVATEIALSFLLLVGTGLVLRTVADLASTDVGFDTEGLLAVTLPFPEWRYPDGAGARPLMASLIERIRALPGVEAAAVATNLPPRTGIWFGVPRVEGDEARAADAESRVFFFNMVGPDFFTALGLPLREGRGPTAEEVADPDARVLVVSESAAREFFPGGGAVGGRFRVDDDGPWYTVIGVAAEVMASGLRGATYPQMYVAANGDLPPRVVVVRTSADPAELAGPLRAMVRTQDPEIPPPELVAVADLYADSIARERFTLSLLAVFAATALVLAAVGLYGVIAQVVGRRTREIGIRMSLGAERAAVFRLVLRQGLATTGLGVVAGAGLAAAGARLLSAGLFGVDAADPVVWGAAAAALAATAVAATWLPARRAARVDPVRAMRAE